MEYTFPYQHGLQVQWQPASEMAIPTATLHHWLLDTGSLTERLEECCRQFSLARLGQGEVPLSANEQRWLPARPAHHWQAREVVLYGDSQPWVFARSILPQSLVRQELANLGNEPLGKRLFNDPRFSRSEFELCRVPASAFCFSGQQRQREELWGRRSRFHCGDDDIIVAEIFLPDAPAYQGS